MSRFCKRLVNPFLYRSIELSDENDKKLAFTEWIMQRLLDTNDELSGQVRHLRIAEFKGTSEVFNVETLEESLGNVKQLTSFSYVSVYCHLLFSISTLLQYTIV